MTISDDSIVGTTDDDKINAGSGDDTVVADAGDDKINAGDGDDVVDAGTGDDTVNAGDGDDTVIAGEGDDLVRAGDGDDSISGGAGSDTIKGGAGDDVLTYNFNDNFNTGFSDLYDGNSHINGDTLLINISQDAWNQYGALINQAFQYYLSTASGNAFNFANDYVIGGENPLAGLDLTIKNIEHIDFEVFVTNSPPTDIALDNAIVEENAEGVVIGNLAVTDPDAGDTHTFSVDDTRFEVVDEQLKLKTGQSLNYEAGPTVNIEITATDAGGLSYSEIFTINVTNVDGVTLHGTDGPDTLSGTPESDYLSGLGGNDSIVGDTDHDTIYGGDGDDTLEGGGHGDSIGGGAGHDSIIGGPGHDTIKGALGDDTIEGGPGNDFMYGQEGVDTLSYEGSSDGVGVTLPAADSGLPATVIGGDTIWDYATGFENIRGSANNDTLVGSTDANVLEGGAGNDTLTGGLGADTFKLTTDDISSGSPYTDVINDFSPGTGGDGDVIDVTEMLPGCNTSNYDSYIDIVADGDDAKLVFDKEGGGNFTPSDHNILLEGVDPTSVDLDALITDGSIVVNPVV